MGGDGGWREGLFLLFDEVWKNSLTVKVIIIMIVKSYCI